MERWRPVFCYHQRPHLRGSWIWPYATGQSRSLVLKSNNKKQKQNRYQLSLLTGEYHVQSLSFRGSLGERVRLGLLAMFAAHSPWIQSLRQLAVRPTCFFIKWPCSQTVYYPVTPFVCVCLALGDYGKGRREVRTSSNYLDGEMGRLESKKAV